jgi:hypothetical protein
VKILSISTLKMLRRREREAPPPAVSDKLKRNML